MRKIVLLLFTFLTVSLTFAQMLEPVKWVTKVEKKGEYTYSLIFEAKIEDDWHVYSQFTPEGGPLAMEIIFKDDKGNFKLVGKAQESATKTAYNDIFEVNETFFEKKARIQQEILVVNPNLKSIEAAINYQVCKESCINSEKKFVFDIPSATTASTVESDTKKKSGEVRDNVVTDSVKQLSNHTVAGIRHQNTIARAANEEQSLASTFIIAFLSGLAALFTPCVFPMIPMTVSFFTKKSKSRAAGIRNAIFYGLSIIIIYVILGWAVTWIFGATALNALATNVWFNIAFFVILILFAFSFLGAFEIVLPNSWANKVDNQADRGGVIGILFMALALAIVSFSCTGPIVGTLLVDAASKGGVAPVVGMLGFSSAVALPFMLFAMFPSWLQSLPKSGGWLNSVKVVLGFLELALALKFLSNADLVLQLHWLEREVFLVLWIAIFTTLALYLFGKLTFGHDSSVSSISVSRLILGILVLSFTIYLIPGLWGAPLKLVSAFVPPLEYSESPAGFGATAAKSKKTDLLPDGAKLGPHQIVTFDDYDKGLAYAKKVNKPILLDFTGFACVNCRKMEANIWSHEDILPRLINDVVLISLYVDDKRKLPLDDQYVSKTSGRTIETIGDKWTEFMITTYKTNTQPLYVLTDLEGNNLNNITPTISYVAVAEFKTWLESGLKNFRK